MIDYFTRHPTLANLLMVSFLLLGLVNLSSIKRETFPEFAPPYVNATVVYPGASPIEVEESLCLPMEDAVDGLANLEEVTCDAQEGFATLRLKLESKADMGRFLVDVQTQINAIQNFPSQIEPPIVKEQDWAEPVVDIAIAADISWPHLKHYAEDLKQRLKVETGVKLVTVSGFSDHQLVIALEPVALRRLGLTAKDIANKVGRQNVKMPAGTLEFKDQNILLRFDERKITPDALSKVVIASGADGSMVRLGDIAKITEGFELEEEHTFFNGKKAAIIKIQKNKAEDALRIKESISAFIEQEQARVPQGISLTLTNDMSSLLQDRLAMMITNGWQGMILVFLSMWLFFSLRYSFWVSAGLPVSFLGGLYLMSLFGISINMLSLVGLLMAIGIMMDDAIVMAESIAAHIDRGHSPNEAVSLGVKKVAPGVISSFLTTILIFSSLLGLDGQMGAVLSAIPVVLIMVLSISLIEAFLILPNHLNHSLNHVQALARADANKTPIPPWYAKWPALAMLPTFKQSFTLSFEHFRNTRLVTMVSFLVKWRYATVGVTIGLFIASIALAAGGLIKFVPFPELDGDIAEARIILPPGSSLQQTQAVVETIIASAKRTADDYSQQQEHGATLLRDITAQYNLNADAGEKGPHVATVRLDLLSAEIRNTLIDEFIYDWRKNTGELAAPISLVFKEPSVGPAGRDIQVRLQAAILDVLKQASISLQAYLSQFDGVNGIMDDMRPGKEEIKVSLRPGAEAYAVDGQLVAEQLRSAFYGQRADEVQVGSENIEIEVKLDKVKAADLQALANFPIMLTTGKQIPLNAIANLSYQRSYVRIQRINSQRTVTIIADVDNRRGNATETLAKVKSEWLVQMQQDFPEVRVDFEGSAKETAKTGKSLAKGFVIGIFGLFLILSFQFKSYVEPIVVMLAIPMALIGVLWGHLLLGYSMSMPSIMGFISLAGIVVNDSILLVQYIRHHVDDGDDVHSAVVNASRERFRAVLLTSLTTAAGLLPLLLESSLQAQIVQPLVVSIVCGIFASTLMVLFVIPCAYAILDDFGLMSKHH
jgi:multidrug efflux pump subunit AcrB